MSDFGSTSPVPRTPTDTESWLPGHWYNPQPLVEQPSPPEELPLPPPRAPQRIFRQRRPLVTRICDWLVAALLLAALVVTGLLGLFVAQKDGLTHWPYPTGGTVAHHRTHGPHHS